MSDRISIPIPKEDFVGIEKDDEVVLITVEGETAKLYLDVIMGGIKDRCADRVLGFMSGFV